MPERVNGSRPGLVLTRLMVRSTLLRRLGLAAGVVAALLMVASSVVSALSLTNQQAIERDLGMFDYATQVPVNLAPGAGLPLRPDRLPASRTAVTVTSLDLQLIERPGERPAYVESDWPHNPLPDRYLLVAGRWPASPGEVALSAEFTGVVHVLGGVPLTVVGQVVDRFDRSRLTMLAGEGTWASWRIDNLAKRFPLTGAGPTYLWSGDPDPALDALAAAAADSVEAPDSVRREMTALLFDRQVYLEADKASAADRFPLVLGLPIVAIPVLAGGLVGAAVGRWSRRITAQLTQIGVSGRLAAAAKVAATSGALFVAAVGGAVVGGGISWPVRPLLDLAANQPLAPFAVAWGDVALVIGGLVVGGLVGLAPPLRLPDRMLGPRVRRGTAGVVALGLVSQLPGPDDGVAMTITYSLLAVLVALLSPELLGWLSGRVGVRSAAAKLGVAMLEPRHRFAATTMVILTALTSMAGGSVAIASGQLTAASEKLVGPIPVGYVLLRSQAATDPVPKSVRQPFEGLLGVSDPLETWGVDGDEFPEGIQGEARLLDSQADFEEWIGHSLTADQAATLADGAIAVAHPPDGPVSIEVGGGRWIEFDSVVVDMPKELAENYGGFLLAPAVAELKLGRVAHELAYVGLTPAQEALLPGAAARLGFEPAYLVIPRTPAAYAMPQSFVWALVALCLVAAVVMVGLVMTQAKALRPRLAALNAIGLPRGWVSRVLSTQVWLVAGVSGGLSLVTVLVGNLLAWVATPEAIVPLADPLALGIVVAIPLVASVVAMPAGLLTLRPGERTVY